MYTTEQIKKMSIRDISRLFLEINKYMPTTVEINNFKETGIPKKIKFIINRKDYCR